MAEATKSNIVRTVTEETYTLTLSADEFLYLKALICTQPTNAGDGASERIWGAMTSDLRTDEVTPEPATEGSTYTVGGVVYDLSAEYRDTSGDVWYFTGKRNGAGVPMLSCRIDDDEYTDWSLIRLHGFYDTLTRV